jgi:hypothetical protein
MQAHDSAHVRGAVDERGVNKRISGADGAADLVQPHRAHIALSRFLALSVDRKRRARVA